VTVAQTKFQVIRYTNMMVIMMSRSSSESLSNLKLESESEYESQAAGYHSGSVTRVMTWMMIPWHHWHDH
jgi:hypothetical protein